MALPENLRVGENSNLSRRSFLALTSGVIAGTASFYPEGVSAQDKIYKTANLFLNQGEEWKDALQDNTLFVEENKQRLKGLSFGFSFSPEELYGLSPANYKTQEKEKLADESLDAIKFMHEDLGINEVRLGVRWKNAVDENGNFDFDFYKTYFDYCLKNGISVCLNLGIKVFRWPEDHVPQKYLEGSPKEKSIITMKDRIASESLEFSDKLLDHLNKNYTQAELSNIAEIQPENEAFNSFGKHGWIMGKDYLTTFVQHIESALPGRKILFNSSEFGDLNNIYDLFGILSNFVDKDRLITGIDYYPFCPANSIEPVAYSELMSFLPGEKTLDDFRNNGYGTPELTEIQAEPWQNFPFPKDNATCLRYITKRGFNDILNPDENGKLRYWGFEYLMHADKKISAPVFDFFKKVKAIKEINPGIKRV